MAERLFQVEEGEERPIAPPTRGSKKKGGGIVAPAVAAVNEALRGISALVAEQDAAPKASDLAFVRDDDFDRMLKAANFLQYGTSARCEFVVVGDRSPSVSLVIQDYIDALRVVADTLSKSVVGRNLVDTVVIAGAEDAKVESFDQGTVTVPNDVKIGNNTLLLPWLKKAHAVVVQYREHLKAVGLGARPSMVVFYSDMRFRDWDDSAVETFKERMRELGMVVVCALFGSAKRDVAEKLSNLPAVDCKDVPLGELLDTLVDTLTQSLEQPGRLEGMLRRAIESLNNKAQQQ